MKKFLPYILIFVIIAGMFTPALEARAQDRLDSPSGAAVFQCWKSVNGGPEIQAPEKNSDTCKDNPSEPNIKYRWGGVNGLGQTLNATGQVVPTASSSNPLWDQIDSCGIGFITGGSMLGCMEIVTYFLFVGIPSFLLYYAAVMFDYMAGLTLSSTLYGAAFIGTIWGTVRDFTNIFFILILLFAAFEMILNLGHGNAKKTVASIIIIALVVNFSLFFTKVVIDASNITALIFYNSIVVDPAKTPTSDAYAGKNSIAGALVSKFNPNAFFTQGTFDAMQVETTASGITQNVPVKVNAWTIMAMMVLYGMIIYVLAYSFAVVALTFLGRIMTLIMLMVVSPFAFVSYAVPQIKKVNTIGFDSWLHTLLETSFMAAILMFIIYMVARIVGEDVFKGAGSHGFGGTLITLFMPALLIIIFLIKGVKYAKKASGEFTGAITSLGSKIAGFAGGAAIGVATGGTAMLARGTVGRAAANLSESNRFRDWAAQSRFGGVASRMVSGTASKSFDLRQAPGVESLAKMGGVNLGAAKTVGMGVKKGFTENRAAGVKKQEEFANKMLDTSDIGRAELSRGRMSTERAEAVAGQLVNGGLDRAAAEKYRDNLMGYGIDSTELANVSRYLNAQRRNTYAARLEKRKITNKGEWISEAQTEGIGQGRRIVSANKIRKSAAKQKEEAGLAHLVHKLEEEMHKGGTEEHKEEKHTPPPTPAPAPAENPPEGGGGAPAGGEHH